MADRGQLLRPDEKRKSVMAFCKASAYFISLYLYLIILIVQAEAVAEVCGQGKQARLDPPADHVFHSSLPQGWLGNHADITFQGPTQGNITGCVDSCCESPICNAAFIIYKLEYSREGDCYLVACPDTKLCLPVKRGSSQTSSNKSIIDSTYILVRGVDFANQSMHGSGTPSLLPLTDANSTTSKARVCEVGLDQEFCRPDEVCVAVGPRSRNGVCQSKEGTLTSAQSEATVPATTTVTTASTTKLQPFEISVSVANKTVRLPKNTASLTAFPVPQPRDDNPFRYEWLVQSNNAHGTEQDSKSETLKLSHLSEGVYIFKVVVTASNPPGYGEAMANVTVLPPQRINERPKAIIFPPNQTVILPTREAILDGSSSTDDNGITSFSWEIASGPVGYQPKMPEVATLTLKDLKPGNYIVRLTVTDADGETDSTEAVVNVLNEIDYPPKANAGGGVIVYLPQNKVILNGNQSSDDHEIVLWEWTREKLDEEGHELAADIQGARTPYLTVANLEEGIYKFVLKVTDSANQSRSDDVYIHVKKPTNRPPEANAGEDQVLTLPIPYFTLDGSASTDDINITAYLWQLVDGPKKVPTIHPINGSIANVTDFTVGKYTFSLTVFDDHDNNATDTVDVTINQDTNQAPKSRIVLRPPAGHEGAGESVAVLPFDSLLLDGSDSSDDLAVERYFWSREGQSSSAGQIVGGTISPQLRLTRLIPGTYSFQLEVWDEQGKSDKSRISFTIQQDPWIKSSVDLTLDRELAHLTHMELKNVLDSIKILVRSKSSGGPQIYLEDLSAVHRTEYARLRFKVEEEKTATGTGNSQQKDVNNAAKITYMSGKDVVTKLKEALKTGPDILGLPVLELETVICQNDCGGHGTCDQATRECVCQPFWTENLFSRYVLKNDPSCDWSVIYVCVVVLLLVLSVVLICVCCTRCRSQKSRSGRSSFTSSRKRNHKYSRLNMNGDTEMTERVGLATTTTDGSDSDEEVLFQSAKKGRRLNGLVRRDNRTTLLDESFGPDSNNESTNA